MFPLFNLNKFIDHTTNLIPEEVMREGKQKGGVQSRFSPQAHLLTGRLGKPNLLETNFFFFKSEALKQGSNADKLCSCQCLYSIYHYWKGAGLSDVCLTAVLLSMGDPIATLDQEFPRTTELRRDHPGWGRFG